MLNMSSFLLPTPPGEPPPLIGHDLRYLQCIHEFLPVVLYCSAYDQGRWTIQYVSQRVTELIGYKPEELKGKKGWMDITAGSHSFYKAIPKHGQGRKRYHLTLKIKCLSGEIKTFSDDGVFIYDQRGHLSGSAGVFVDITTQKQAEEAMAAEYHRLRNLIKRPISLFGIVGNSQSMQEVFSRIIKLAASNANVVINGESGTGKELAAKAIHELSNRSGKPFIAVNCSAISENLFESEFFGHVKGSFTGALGNRQGYLDLANGGTIFLDEVGEISLGLQAKLLRALDGYGYLAVGGNNVKTSNFRLIAATNRNLAKMVKEGAMREDFYFRIKTFALTMPPLRERSDDIPLLAHHFTRQISSSKDKTLSFDVLEHLCEYDWPGNVRELQSVIYRYLTFQELGLETEHRADLEEAAKPPDLLWPPEPQTFANAWDAPLAGTTACGRGLEPAELVTSLNRNLWNISKTAAQLGLSRATLYRKMKRWALKRPV